VIAVPDFANAPEKLRFSGDPAWRADHGQNGLTLLNVSSSS
jgi:hypothetical protein